MSAWAELVCLQYLPVSSPNVWLKCLPLLVCQYLLVGHLDLSEEGWQELFTPVALCF